MTVSDIQKRLAELGLYKGRIDGISGPMTLAAIRGFQRLHKLTDDGRVGPKTRAELWPAAMPERDASVPMGMDGTVSPGGDAPVWPRQHDVSAYYGGVGKNQVMLELPFTMKLAWDKNQRVTRFSVHKKVHDSAARAFAAIAEAYDAKARAQLGIDLFGGCLNVRKMRGGSSWSMHSWGIAIDFDPARNQLKWGRDRARLALPDARRFWEIWEAEGWVSLGRARNYDWMHVQAARL